MIAPFPERSRLLTLGEIAKRLSVSIHRIKYCVDEYAITPAGRLGIMRYWHEEDLPRIKSALNRIASNRGGGR